MNAFKKISEGNVTSILDGILASDWQEITARQEHPMSSHKDTEAIFLRWCKSQDVESVFTDLDAVDYPALKRHPGFQGLLAYIVEAVGGSKLGRALIVNLKPGGSIEKHIDEGAYADYYDRFHLVLSSEDNVFFQVDHTSEDHYETVIMKPGELWWFDHKRPHRVDNMSDRGRIHLIVDVKTSRVRGGTLEIST